MKILKIELQNINSLRSETPIVIDFEAEQFKDVGLYAITGSTGAGKTTILDAITIALYNQVPRFNASNVKATLKDVVSYGAHDAFTRLTFENKGERFEAYYGIRLAAKNGKKLTNPDEKVLLKNLTTNKIIAEKKREAQLEIERVTQLTYNQFLRSVMLAQGEFASFLSAKASEKGKLLEQITGEDIYKKIGEVITQKKGDESKKLESLKSKINSEDILSSEQVTLLNEEQKGISKEVKKLDKQISENDDIINWYQRNENLEEQKILLASQSENLKKALTDNQTNIERLAANDKAEPFKDAINNILRIEKEITSKSKDLEAVKEALGILLHQIKQTKNEVSEIEQDLIAKKQEDKEWQPKLEELIHLDSKIENENKNLKKTSSNVSILNKAIEALEANSSSLKSDKVKKHQQITSIETYINQHPNTPHIEKQVTRWSSDLTVLSQQKSSIDEAERFCNAKKEEAEKISKNLKKGRGVFTESKSKLVQLESELSAIEKQLADKKVNILLAQKEGLEKQRSGWSTLLELSKAHDKYTLELDAYNSQYTALESQESEFATLLLKYDAEIAKLKSSISDSETIIALESKIKSFEAERLKLEDGKACNLCGATEHPFVEKYKNTVASDSEKALKNKKIELEEIQEQKNSTDRNLTKTITLKASILKQIKSHENELGSTNTKASELNLTCSITESEAISNQVSKITNELNILSDEILTSQNLQTQKEAKVQALSEQKEVVNEVNNNIILLEERISNLNREVSEKQTLSQKTSLEHEKLKHELQAKLAEYNLKIPSLATYKQFIQELETSISKYNAQSKALIQHQNEISEIDINLANSNKRIEEKKRELKVELTSKKETEKNISEFTKERNSILALDISVEQKRNMLQGAKEDCEAKWNIAIDKHQKLTTEKASKATLEEAIKSDISKAKTELADSNTSLNLKIKESSFSTKSEISTALLSAEDKANYSKIKEQLSNKKVELDTLNEKLTQEISLLETEKNFDTSIEDALETLAQYKSAKEEYTQRSGEIKQQFDMDNQIKQRNKDVFDSIELQEKVVKKWSNLIALLGGSKDAFNTYVQRLTLNNLIEYANIHLYKLNRRYSLKMNDTYKSGEELNFNLIDHYQTDEIRYIDTSSGGEKFLISLALALGLSDLSSNNVQIDSLFIDEGFGTLDNNTLEIVISTLETLQAQGKMIGIISHVENLKERIPIQIQVKKKSNGVSVVELAGREPNN